MQQNMALDHTALDVVQAAHAGDGEGGDFSSYLAAMAMVVGLIITWVCLCGV